MRIVEIESGANGAHRNQTISGVVAVPDGWAVIPDGMELPDTFPFVDILVEGQVVTSVTAGVVPEPEPVVVTELEQLRADVDYIAMETGVEL